MTTIAEIESAIAQLPEPQVAELAAWLEQHRRERTKLPSVEDWLRQACGAARPDVTTDELLALTRETT